MKKLPNQVGHIISLVIESKFHPGGNKVSFGGLFLFLRFLRG
jgi:hypothetical protein